jgi:hypothetical protein
MEVPFDGWHGLDVDAGSLFLSVRRQVDTRQTTEELLQRSLNCFNMKEKVRELKHVLSSMKRTIQVSLQRSNHRFDPLGARLIG